MGSVRADKARVVVFGIFVICKGSRIPFTVAVESLGKGNLEGRNKAG